MASFAYTPGVGKLPKLFDKIHDVGQPSGKVTQTWLKQVGFASSNDRSLLSVLRQVGFLDSGGSPSELWADYRKATAGSRKTVLGRAIMNGYSQLYEMYPNAHERTDDELEAFFRGHVSAGSQVLQRTIQTYKSLAAIATFDESVVSGDSNSIKLEPKEVPEHLPSSRIPAAVGSSMTIAINVQLAVPETKDAEVYDAFFQSMKKHLLT